MTSSVLPWNWSCNCLGLKNVTDFFKSDTCTAKKVAVVVAAGLTVLYVSRKLSKKAVHIRKQYPRDTVVLHQFGRGRTTPSISPFCLKLETYLRVAKIPYENDSQTPFGPNRKTPWISYHDASIPDSARCIDYLNSEFNVNLNAQLDDDQLAIAHAFQIMVDEHLFWCLVLHRFVYDQRNEYQNLMRWPVPIPLSIFDIFFKRLWIKRAKHQGIGCHSPQVVAEFAKKDLKAISDYLGEKYFLFGSEVSEVDCALFGTLAQFLWTSPANAPFVKWFSVDFRNLESYCIRMKELAFPDWEKCLLS